MNNYKFPTVEDLLEAGVHFGHSINKWNPKMEPYIYAAKQGVHILDLDQTQKLLKEAGEYLYDIASRGGQIIFVCTKKQVAQIAKEQALRCGALYMNERWIGGTITNFSIIKKSVDKLISLRKKRDAGNLSMFTKKERILIDREIDKLEKYFGGVVGLKGEPQAVFLVDARRERTAINECRIFDVPVVALVDTNSDPTGIYKLIPGNDDAAKSVGKVFSVIADCIEAGYKEFEKNKAVDKAKRGEGATASGLKQSGSEAERLTDAGVGIDANVDVVSDIPEELLDSAEVEVVKEVAGSKGVKGGGKAGKAQKKVGEIEDDEVEESADKASEKIVKRPAKEKSAGSVEKSPKKVKKEEK